MEAHVREKQLRTKTRLMILVMVLAGPLGNTLLAKGMKSMGAICVSSFSDACTCWGRS